MNFDIQEFNNVGMNSFLKVCRIDKYFVSYKQQQCYEVLKWKIVEVYIFGS